MPPSSREVFLGQDPLDQVALTAPLTCLLKWQPRLSLSLFPDDFLTFCSNFPTARISRNFSENKARETSLGFSPPPASLGVTSCVASVWMRASSHVQKAVHCPPQNFLVPWANPPCLWSPPLPLPVSLKGGMTVAAQQVSQWQLHGDPFAQSLWRSRPSCHF